MAVGRHGGEMTRPPPAWPVRSQAVWQAITRNNFFRNVNHRIIHNQQLIIIVITLIFLSFSSLYVRTPLSSSCSPFIHSSSSSSYPCNSRSPPPPSRRSKCGCLSTCRPPSPCHRGRSRRRRQRTRASTGCHLPRRWRRSNRCGPSLTAKMAVLRSRV
jgi:hypothetical protein